MQVKSFAATLGAGMLAGAAVMLMIPRHSAVYQAADDAAESMRHGVSRAMDSMLH